MYNNDNLTISKAYITSYNTYEGCVEINSGGVDIVEFPSFIAPKTLFAAFGS